MSIGRLRIEDITVHNYIKYEVLGLYYVEQETDQSLSYDSSLGLYMPSYDGLSPSPISPGRGWVPFDESLGYINTSTEQTGRVSVVGSSSYEVNYLLGGIQSISGVPTSVSYYWNYVSVVDGWPGTDPPPLPIVAIDIVANRKLPYQLGGGKITERDTEIHIFATSNAERDDLTETIFDAIYLKKIKLIDYSQGDYLEYSGLFSSSFTSSEVSGSSGIYFEDISTRTISSVMDWSDLNKYRSVISCTLMTYVD
jgi:hypothetical protein